MSRKNSHVQELERLIRNWERYRDLVTAALNAEESSDRQEKAFLGLKAELAAQLQWLSDTLPRSMAYESHQSVDVMADMMRRHVTLCTYDMGERWELKDFENSWHQYFIYLNRLRGTDLRSPDPDGAAAQTPSPRGSGFAGRLGWTVAFAFAGLLLFVVTSAAGLGWDMSGPTFATPQSLQQAFANVSGLFATLAQGPIRLFEPLTTAYGAQWSFGLVAALAVLSGAFFVSRGQN